LNAAPSPLAEAGAARARTGAAGPLPATAPDARATRAPVPPGAGGVPPRLFGASLYGLAGGVPDGEPGTFLEEAEAGATAGVVYQPLGTVLAPVVARAPRKARKLKRCSVCGNLLLPEHAEGASYKRRVAHSCCRDEHDYRRALSAVRDMSDATLDHYRTRSSSPQMTRAVRRVRLERLLPVLTAEART
jgi:hypothetical protein